MKTVVIAILVIALWSTWRSLRWERRWRAREMYLFIEAARAAGKSNTWINEALVLRGLDSLVVPNPAREESDATIAFTRLFRAWREQGLSPSEIRKRLRKRGWPIPLGYRGDQFLSSELFFRMDDDPPPHED